MKTLKVSELTQEQHEDDVELTLLSAEDRRVLDACSNLRISRMGLDGHAYIQNDGALDNLTRLELARREST